MCNPVITYMCSDSTCTGTSDYPITCGTYRLHVHTKKYTRKPTCSRVPVMRTWTTPEPLILLSHQFWLEDRRDAPENIAKK
jgi:hypothetical protein